MAMQASTEAQDTPFSSLTLEPGASGLCITDTRIPWQDSMSNCCRLVFTGTFADQPRSDRVRSSHWHLASLMYHEQQG